MIRFFFFFDFLNDFFTHLEAFRLSAWPRRMDTMRLWHISLRKALRSTRRTRAEPPRCMYDTTRLLSTYFKYFFFAINLSVGYYSFTDCIHLIVRLRLVRRIARLVPLTLQTPSPLLRNNNKIRMER
jgi:hypothetical protein